MWCSLGSYTQTLSLSKHDELRYCQRAVFVLRILTGLHILCQKISNLCKGLDLCVSVLLFKQGSFLWVVETELIVVHFWVLSSCPATHFVTVGPSYKNFFIKQTTEKTAKVIVL